MNCPIQFQLPLEAASSADNLNGKLTDATK